MASHMIALNEPAHQLLVRLKKNGKSFSQVIIDHLRPVPETCGELLDELERDFEGVPVTTAARLRKLKAGRGRRSNRSK